MPVLRFAAGQAMHGFPVVAPLRNRGWGPIGITFLYAPMVVTLLALPAVWAFFLSFGARRLFGARGDFGRTFRIVCYASAPAAVEVVPLPWISLLVWPYAWYLAMRGLQHTEDMSAARALATVLTSLPALCLVPVLLMVPYLGSFIFLSVWLVLLVGPWAGALVGAFHSLRNATRDRPWLEPRWTQRHGGEH